MVLLSGEMDGKEIQAKLRKLELNNLLLNSRGFHWISDFPFNRQKREGRKAGACFLALSQESE